MGGISAGEVNLTKVGRVVKDGWYDLLHHYEHIELDEFVIMPNHVHGIINIVDDRRGTASRAPTRREQFGRPVSGSLPSIIRSFKSASTRRINVMRKTPGQPVWQRNYYEHIIKGETDLDRIRQYIRDNPARWADDIYNPTNVSRSNV